MLNDKYSYKIFCWELKNIQLKFVKAKKKKKYIIVNDKKVVKNEIIYFIF